VPVEALVGLLSPRRGQYSLSVETSQTLRPIPRPLQVGNVLARNVQTSVDIRESEQLRATDFTVDASFIAGFHLSGMIEKPPFSGRVSFAYDTTIPGQQGCAARCEHGETPLNNHDSGARTGVSSERSACTRRRSDVRSDAAGEGMVAVALIPVRQPTWVPPLGSGSPAREWIDILGGNDATSTIRNGWKRFA
jgi:hypothetical protein